MQRIEFVDGDNKHYIVSVPVSGQEKTLRLRMWVAYDKGNRWSNHDYKEVKRGYYLYFSLEEPSFAYPARIIVPRSENCRVYLGAVSRHSKGWYRDFSRVAEKFVRFVVEDFFSDMQFVWEELYKSSWDGEGSGVGMYCDYYKTVNPKKEWLSAEGGQCV